MSLLTLNVKINQIHLICMPAVQRCSSDGTLTVHQLIGPFSLPAAVISPASVSGSPSLSKSLSSGSSLGSMDTGGTEPMTGLITM